jgi:hypothetical protein
LGVYTKKHGFKKLAVPDNIRDEEEMDVQINNDT